MGVKCEVVFNSEHQDGKIVCNVPITRSDLIQECDVAEDLCIAFGYENIKPKLPPSFTMGGETKLNKMSDLLRE